MAVFVETEDGWYEKAFPKNVRRTWLKERPAIDAGITVCYSAENDRIYVGGWWNDRDDIRGRYFTQDEADELIDALIDARCNAYEGEHGKGVLYGRAAAE